MESQQSPQAQNKILLDISLFVLDMLSPEKIKENYGNRDDGIVLEVPSAFITMIADAQVGNLLLRRFIGANLEVLKNNPIHISSNDPKIKKLVNSTPQEIEEIKEFVHKTILSDFLPLIKDVSKIDEINKSLVSSDYPIKIYEPLIPISSSELQALRRAYWQELHLDSHPLFDLYFLQISHAQTIGYPEEVNLRRQLLSVGRATFKTIDVWRQLLFGDSQESKEHVIGSRPLTSEDRSLREFLRLLVERYFREDWRDVVSDIVDIGVDLGLTIAQTGVLGWRDAAIQIILLRGKKLVVESLTETNLPIEKRVFKGVLGSLLIYLVCLMLVIGPILYIGFVKLFISSVDEEIILPEIIITVTEGLMPTATSSATPSPIIEPILTNTPFPVDAIPTLVTVEAHIVNDGGDLSYCMYVVQPGDTIQSVALRFHVSENDLRSSNKLIELNVFVVNQLIKVNNSCCAPIGGNGFSYTVKYNDDLYSISEIFSVKESEIVRANNLYNPNYIQTGQMLCIPNR